MGRTLPTFTERADALFLEWSPFRRALRREDQEVFDTLLSDVRRHAQAGTALSPLDPWPVLLLSMLIEERKGRLSLLRQVERLEKEKIRDALPS